MSPDILIELALAGKVLLAAVLGGFLGMDRERENKSAGIRTYSAVCLGAGLFACIATHFADTNAAARLIANIITGIGFLCAGIIYRNTQTNDPGGLTTAASVWVTASIGVSVALDFFILALLATFLLHFLLRLNHYTFYKNWRDNIRQKANADTDNK